MNPGYEGTYDPQYATKSRLIEMHIPYPNLYKNPDDPSSGYSASEALKIARGVDSLMDFTLDDTFESIWDYEVNQIGEEQKLTQAQRFDLRVVLALVQFSNKLREEFIKEFEGDMDDHLPVTQPITLREMRNCAGFLSMMSDSEKTGSNWDEVAKDLIKTFFSVHIYSKTDRDQINTTMDAQYTSKTHVAVSTP